MLILLGPHDQAFLALAILREGVGLMTERELLSQLTLLKVALATAGQGNSESLDYSLTLAGVNKELDPPVNLAVIQDMPEQV